MYVGKKGENERERERIGREGKRRKDKEREGKMRWSRVSTLCL
jgi:hypothetical protein